MDDLVSIYEDYKNIRSYTPIVITGSPNLIRTLRMYNFITSYIIRNSFFIILSYDKTVFPTKELFYHSLLKEMSSRNPPEIINSFSQTRDQSCYGLTYYDIIYNNNMISITIFDDIVRKGRKCLAINPMNVIINDKHSTPTFGQMHPFLYYNNRCMYNYGISLMDDTALNLCLSKMSSIQL